MKFLKVRDDELEIKLIEIQGNLIIQNQNNQNITTSYSYNRVNKETYISKIEKIISHKWYSKIKLIVKRQNL